MRPTVGDASQTDPLGNWAQRPHTLRVIAKALSPFGTTVFAEISPLALQHGAVNLGQGFPDFDGPDWVRQAAADALLTKPNQYAPTNGLPDLTSAIARRWSAATGSEIDPAQSGDRDRGVHRGHRCDALGHPEPRR